MSNPNNKWKVPLALVLLAVAIAFGMKKNSDYNKLQDAFKEDKLELEADLDEVVKNYQQAIDDKTELSGKLEIELNKIVKLRDSVKLLKGNNYSLISRFRKRILKLEKENKALFAKVKELRELNTDLIQENEMAKELLIQKDSLNEELTNVNTKLSEIKDKLQAKVDKAGVVAISKIDATALRERNNGKYTSVSRARRTDAFRVTFNMLKNEVSNPGKRSVYVQIIDESNKVIAQKGVFKSSDGNETPYSDLIIANYQNEAVSVVSLVQVKDEELSKGTYTINAFIDSLIVGKSTVRLR